MCLSNEKQGQCVRTKEETVYDEAQEESESAICKGKQLEHFKQGMTSHV